MEQLGETQNQRKSRVSWRNDKVMKTFLEACIGEITKNGRLGGSLKLYSWSNVGEILKNTHNFIVDHKQMKNRYDYIKGKYTAWCQLKRKTENHYDPTTNTFNFTDEEWELESKANKHVESLRTSPLSFPELCTQLYDGTAATGIDGWGPSSKRDRTVELNKDLEIHSIEDIPFSTQAQESSNPSPNPSTPGTQSHASTPNFEGQRPKKKAKNSTNKSNNSKIEEEMCKALKLIVNNNSGPSLKECKDKLNRLGWGSQNPLHKMALGIFCESASYREKWMLLEDDENEAWVEIVSRKLGFVV